MRGKGISGKLTYSNVGITPAYAGKSVFLLTVILILWDHPRLCGEK